MQFPLFKSVIEIVNQQGDLKQHLGTRDITNVSSGIPKQALQSAEAN